MKNKLSEVKTHYGKVTTTMFEKGEYTIFEVVDKMSLGVDYTEIEFRNVGEINKDSAIQFTVDCRKNGRRRQYVSFSIPLDLCKEFIDRLSGVKTSASLDDDSVEKNMYSAADDKADHESDQLERWENRK